MELCKKKYDIVIIGSGLGGLLCGVLLGKKGYSVCVLEKHFQIGGNLQTFRRNGCEFNTGMHYVGSFDKDQILYKIFHYLDILDDVKLTRLDTSAFETIYIGNDKYTYASGIENFQNTLIHYFPDDVNAIKKYVSKLLDAWSTMSILNLRPFNENSYLQIDILEENAFDYITSLTDNKRLRSVLAATNGLYAGKENKTPFHVHALINKFFIDSAWRISNGGTSLAKAMKNKIEKQGGMVSINKEAISFDYIDKKIAGVKLGNGEIIQGDNFISNLHPQQTIKMAGRDRFRKAFVKRIDSLENSIGSFCLFIVLKKQKIKYINSNLYHLETDNVWGASNYDMVPWPSGYILYTSVGLLEYEFAESITVVTQMKYSDVIEWENTTVGKRGEAYEAFKETRKNMLLNLVEKRIPEIRDCIEYCYSSTPLTYRDYTGIPEGSMYGILKDCNDPMSTFMATKTHIPNLFLTGQSISMHGILGVTVGALNTCGNILDLDTIIEEIREGK